MTTLHSIFGQHTGTFLHIYPCSTICHLINLFRYGPVVIVGFKFLVTLCDMSCAMVYIMGIQDLPYTFIHMLVLLGLWPSGLGLYMHVRTYIESTNQKWKKSMPPFLNNSHYEFYGAHLCNHV